MTGARRWPPIAVVAIALLMATPAPAGALTDAAACPLMPADNVWHADVSSLPVAAASAQYVTSMGAAGSLHPDFGSGKWDGGPIGIPFTTVGSGQKKVAVTFKWPGESDAGPYPIPKNVPIEGGPNSKGDRHVIVVDRDRCTLYELYNAYPNADGTWKAGSGAIYDLTSDALRHASWTSADAAGLPILPGLVTYDEVASGHIDHAIRVTADATQNSFIWPARHQAGDADTSLPPMGLRLRLKAGVDISGFSPFDRVILQALQTYGMIVADNGTSWYISGAPDPRWNNDDLHALGQLHGSDFEAVDESALAADPNSGRVTGAPRSIWVTDAHRAETASGTAAMKFTLSLSAPSAGAVSVNVATADGTAHAPDDYLAKNKTVVFPAGTTKATVAVNVVGDTVAEPDETFNLQLSSPVGATIGRAYATGTIKNDD